MRMQPEAIDKFFAELGRLSTRPIRVVLVGGAAAILYGCGRPTEDIDFEVRLGDGEPTPKEEEEASVLIERARMRTGAVVQFNSDWDRVSSIAMPKKSPSAIPYKNFGLTKVFLMHPNPWSIGKLSRYTARDIADICAVFAKHKKKLKLTANGAAAYWGRAVGESPFSDAQNLFRQQAGDFFREYGKKIWGKKVEPKALMETFMKSARNARSGKQA